jgi:hypothetical protein
MEILTAEELRLLDQVRSRSGDAGWSTVAERLRLRGYIRFSSRFDCYELTQTGAKALSRVT